MALKDMELRKLKPKEKAYKMHDSAGLYLLVKPNGQGYWRFKYRFGGKERLLALGVYPEVSLALARQKRDEARQQIANLIDPNLIKQQRKKTKNGEVENSFELVAREWHAKQSSKWTENHATRLLTGLEKNIFPWIGARPISELMATELLSVLERIEARGAIETAHRNCQTCGQIFRYAVTTGRAARDCTQDLRGALKPISIKHHASIVDPKEVAGLLRAIKGYEGHFVTKIALQLAPLVFVRPGELRQAEWSEIDFEQAEWRIPAHKMKMRTLHIVPLSKQAIALLKEIQPLTGDGKYVFPSIRSKDRPMSENTILAALRRLGYSTGEMTGHGFRSMASTLLNEQGYNRDAIERQLAHSERNGVRAAYNYAEYLPERRQMMEDWAGYLEKLAQGATLLTFLSKAI